MVRRRARLRREIFRRISSVMMIHETLGNLRDRAGVQRRAMRRERGGGRRGETASRRRSRRSRRSPSEPSEPSESPGPGPSRTGRSRRRTRRRTRRRPRLGTTPSAARPRLGPTPSAPPPVGAREKLCAARARRPRPSRHHDGVRERAGPRNVAPGPSTPPPSSATSRTSAKRTSARGCFRRFGRGPARPSVDPSSIRVLAAAAARRLPPPRGEPSSRGRRTAIRAERRASAASLAPARRVHARRT